MESETRDRLLELLKHLGIGWGFHGGMGSHGQGWPWDGREMDMDASYFDIVHDLAHWLVAAPAQREFWDFELGGPENRSAWSDHQESLTQLLSVLLLRAVQGRDGEWRTLYQEYLWRDVRWHVRWWIRELQKRELIVGTEPKCWLELKQRKAGAA